MFFESFKNISLAVMQIIILAAIGYFLVKRKIIADAGLDVLSRLVVEVTLPILIFCQLLRDFRFGIYPNWWIFPLISFLITGAGLAAGAVFSGFINGGRDRRQFLSLIAFQNSGYLPLALVSSLLPKDKADTLFIYIFLFLLGFNLVIWSLGAYIISFRKSSKFELGSLFSPPVIATLFSLICIFLGLNKFVPEFLFKPLKTAGECTVPLAMIIVGGNLAQIHLKRINQKAIGLMVLLKMLILPALGFWLVVTLKLPQLFGLLVIMELAVPPATSLSVIMRHYKQEDILISQGIFFGHIVSVITIPLFLGLYFAHFMVN